MDNHKHESAKINNFSLAFQQMCSMVAIGQTKSQDETLRELILHTLVLVPEENIFNEHDFGRVLNSLFGFLIADHEIKYTIERLVAEGILIPSDSGSYILQSNVKAELITKINSSISLENKVRDGWMDELEIKYPILSFPESWSALRNYLAGAFLRHGIQAVALLDSSIELDQIYSQSLTELLRDATKDCPIELQPDIKNAISGFVATAGQFPERSTYIAQLADGAFSYFSLATDPHTADQFRKYLYPLMLFLDTNFLFGILGLTVNPQVAVSNELLRVINQYKFPFKLKRHDKTQNELLTSVQKYENDFIQRHWSKSISRAALTSRFLTGVEIRYHQAFVETGIDVGSFFLPYHHADVLLNDKSIEYYASSDQEQAAERIATLIADYTDFLKSKKKDKPYRIIDHDMTVLDVVRKLRSNAKSTLEAGALFITCDYSLYAFDWGTSKKHGIMPCTVLPNLFWQILRPFIPSDKNFSQAFAQTFAIPEFRTIGSGASEACSKMINIMSGYQNFPEETASRMLSNDILIEQLRKAESDEAFQAYIEAAIVNENAQLLGENILLTKKYEVEQTEKIEMADKLEKTIKLTQQKDDEIKIERQQRKDAEEAANAEKIKSQKSEEKLNLIFSIINASFIGLILIIAFEALIYLLHWNWLINHANSYGLQAGFDLLLLSLSFAAFVRKWRSSIWIPLLISLGGILIQLLGGPK